MLIPDKDLKTKVNVDDLVDKSVVFDVILPLGYIASVIYSIAYLIFA